MKHEAERGWREGILGPEICNNAATLTFFRNPSAYDALIDSRRAWRGRLSQGSEHQRNRVRPKWKTSSHSITKILVKECNNRLRVLRPWTIPHPHLSRWSLRPARPTPPLASLRMISLNPVVLSPPCCSLLFLRTIKAIYDCKYTRTFHCACTPCYKPG